MSSRLDKLSKMNCLLRLIISSQFLALSPLLRKRNVSWHCATYFQLPNKYMVGDPHTYKISTPHVFSAKKYFTLQRHFVPARMADSQRGTKRPSDTPNAPKKRPKRAKKPTPEPSSPLHPIPTSPNTRTTTQQTLDFQPLQGLHFDRSIVPLPDAPFEIFQLFCPLELV